MKKKLLLLFFSLLSIFSLIGCNASDGEKGGKASPDWSRGISLGEGIIGSIGLVVDESHDEIYVAWPIEGGQIQYKHFTSSGELLSASDLNFTGQLRMPRLALADENYLHFIYSSRLAGGQVWKLWYSQLGVDGELKDKPIQISSDDMNVGDFSIAPDQLGGVLVSWDNRQDGSLYLLHLDEQGMLKSGPHEITSQGVSPSLFVNSDGFVHLSWISDGDFFYAEIPLDNLSAARAVRIVDIKMGTGSSLAGPVIGVSEGWVYILWSISSQSGLEAGTARTSYISFPVGQAGLSEAKPVRIFMDEDQKFSPYIGRLPLTQLTSPPHTVIGISDFVMHPAAMKEIGSEMVAAVVARQNLRLNNQLQIATLVFDQGQYKGYLFAAKTQQLSDNPVVSLDSSGHIFLVWRDGISRENVYYATTQPGAVAVIDQLNSMDIKNALLEGVTESLIGIAFMPFIGFGWLLPGLMIMGIWKMFKDQEDVRDPQSWIPLFLSLLVYYVIKIATLPTIASYVPFSAWLYIPDNWELILRIATPLVIFAIAMLVARIVFVRYSQSAVVCYISLGFTDALLTLAIYGVNFLGVF